ncbi:hypothetical protein JXC34_07025 [Candidatus Woesearchaeota archaeon]|nr:hypothetical protein [Candidatus Woesearchaeota archaeon]
MIVKAYEPFFEATLDPSDILHSGDAITPGDIRNYLIDHLDRTHLGEKAVVNDVFLHPSVTIDDLLPSPTWHVGLKETSRYMDRILDQLNNGEPAQVRFAYLQIG